MRFADGFFKELGESVRTLCLTRTIPLVTAVACSMGCASTIILASDDYFEVACAKDEFPRVYAGPFFDALLATDALFAAHFGDQGPPTPWELRALAALDVPLSLAADTLYLPVTVPMEMRDWLACGSAPVDEPIVIQKSGEEIEIEGEE